MERLLIFFRNFTAFSIIAILLFSNVMPVILNLAGQKQLAKRLEIKEARAVAQGDGKIIYGEGTITDPRTSDWAAGTFTTEGNTITAGATIRHTIVKAAPTRDEMLVGIQTTGGTLYIQRWNGTAWSNEWNVAVGDGNLPRFDIAYERSTGDAMVVYGRNVGTTNEIGYNIWNGTSWGGAVNYDAVRTSGIVQGVAMATVGGTSNDFAIAWGDANLDLSANYWDGTNNVWKTEPSAALSTGLDTLAAATSLTGWSFDLDFELSGQLLIAWGNAAATDISFVTRGAGAAGAWGTVTAATAFAEQSDDLELTADPNSDRMILVHTGSDSGNDMEAAVWDGSTFPGSIDTAIPCAQNVVCVIDASVDTTGAGTSGNAAGWLTSGAATRGIITYDDANAAGVDWAVWDSTNGWVLQTDCTTACSSQPASGDDKMHRLRPNPFSDAELMAVFVDTNSDLWAKKLAFDGTNLTWSSADGGTTLEATLSSITGFAADFSYNRFIPANSLTISVTAGSKVAAKNSGAVDQYAHDVACTGAASCAAFTLAAAGGTVNVTSIKITENGTVTANTELSDANLYYDTDGNWADAGTETLFGTAATFAADQTATITGTLAISAGQTAYIYVRYDLANGTTYPIGGTTVNFGIAAASDVVSDGTESGSGTLVGTQTVLPVIDNYTNTETGLNWAASCTGCGARIGPRSASQHQAVTINGKGFGTDPGAGLRDSATNKVEIVGVSTNLIDDDGTANTNVQSWNNTTIVINTSSEQTGDTDTDWGTNFGDSAALRVTAGSQAVATDREFFIFPQITSLAVPGGNPANSARETESITLNGTRFGSSQGTGTVTILTVAAGAASSWTNTAITVTVPTAIGDGLGGAADYTGNVVVTQGTGTNSKAHTYGTSFRILPRITSLTPNSGPNATSTTIAGDHLCQPSGTCQTAATWNTTANDGNDVKWGTANATVTGTPTNTQIIANAPTLTDGAYSVTVTSGGGTPYTSNGLTFTIANNALTVSTSGSQVATITRGTNNNSLSGTANPSGAFTFVTSASAATITSIKVSETVAGFVANNNLNNIKLYGDTGGTVAGQYEPGLDTQIGTTQATFAADETVTFGGLTLAINTTAISVYVVADIDADPTSGQTIEIQIINPSTDVAVTSASNADTVAKAIAGTTTVANPNMTVAAAGSQPINVIRGSTANNLGGTFTLTMASATGSLSTIAISEQGTVAAATNLTSVKLQSDTDGTYPGTDITGCTALSFVAGTPEKVTCTPTGGLALTTTTTYIYVVANVASGATAGQTIELEINVSGDVTGTGFNVSGTFPVQITGTTTIQDPSLTVGTTGTQAVNIDSGSSSNNIGGSFTFVLTGATGTLNSFVISELGGITANTNISNVEVQSDTDGTYPGVAVTGCTTLTFNASQQFTCTPTGGLSLSTATRYVYLVINFTSGATGGDTVEVQITNPSTDVSVTGASNTDTVAKLIAGTTTIRPIINSYTNSSEAGLNWAASCTGCGARIGPAASSQSQTVVISGAGFGADPGAGSRDTATNKVEIVGVATTLLTDNIGSTNVTAWSTTSITITTDTGVPANTDTNWGTNFGDSAALRVTAGSQAVAIDREFFIFPQITSISTNTGVSNGTREYSASDNHGVITLNGTRLGTALGTGYVRILGCDNTTCTSPTGSVAIDSWSNTAIQARVPTVIADNSYTGAVDIQQGTGTNSKNHTFSTLRVLPRVTAFSPATPAVGDAVQIQGDHFCQSGTCPTGSVGTDADTSSAPAFSTNDRITFTSSQVATYWGANWSHAAIPNTADTQVPSAAVSGGVVLRSGGYDSNAQSITLADPTPTSPTTLEQHKDSQGAIILVQEGTNETTADFKMNTTSAATGGTMFAQVEIKTVGTVFTSPATCSSTLATCFEKAAGSAYSGGTISLWVDDIPISTLASGDYHWQTRIRYNKNGINYFSPWVSFGGNTENPPTNPAATDFYVDTVAPTISVGTPPACSTNPTGTNLQATTATISWSPSDTYSTTFTKQVEYDTDSSLANPNICSPGSTCGTPTSGYALNQQEVTLTGLTPNTAYYYRVRSKDVAGNETITPSAAPFCQFTTNKGVVRTIEQFISQETGAAVSGVRFSRNFNVTINENNVIVNSAIIEITGLTLDPSPSNQVFEIQLKQGLGTAFTPNAEQYSISTNTVTPFQISFNAKDTPSGCTGCQNMQNITGPNTYSYTLHLMPTNASVHIIGAKLILTYQYAE